MTDLRKAGRYFILMMAIAFASHAARAEVTGIEIASRTEVLAGKSFGDAGSYEKIIGKVHLAVDPGSAASIVARAMVRWDAAAQATPFAGKYLPT
jgi:hypothetical protein